MELYKVVISVERGTIHNRLFKFDISTKQEDINYGPYSKCSRVQNTRTCAIRGSPF